LSRSPKGSLDDGPRRRTMSQEGRAVCGLSVRLSFVGLAIWVCRDRAVTRLSAKTKLDRIDLEKLS
ncbi:MAG: hypothetical protein ACREH9_10850, partial [Pseudomonadota bacterium]